MRVILNLKMRSFADEVGSNLAVVFKEAAAYLKASDVSKEEVQEIVQLCIRDWDAYQWIGASLDGRVRGTAGANEMRSKFALLSAALAHYYSDRAVHILNDLAECTSASDVSDILTINNPGDRDIGLGLNAASGAAMLARCASLSERAILNHRLALKIPGLEGMAEVQGRAHRMLDELQRRKVVNTKNAKAERPLRRATDHEELREEFKSLLREGFSRREANGKLFQRGRASRPTINRITEKVITSEG